MALDEHTTTFTVVIFVRRTLLVVLIINAGKRMLMDRYGRILNALLLARNFVLMLLNRHISLKFLLVVGLICLDLCLCI